MIIRGALLCSLLALVGCDDYPRDPEGTLARVSAEKSFKAGIVAGADPAGIDPAAMLLVRVGERTGARALIERGSAEPLLAKLEAGELDLVIGDYVSTTPWSTNVSLSPPLAIRHDGGAEIHVVAAMRNGENAWIGLVEREARKLGAGLK